MTRAFTPAQKHRILVLHRAMVLADGVLTPIALVAFGTPSAARRYALAREWGGAVMCACGCKVWARLDDIDFDHERAYANYGTNSISNGRPLRRRPCHAAKTAVEAGVTGKVTSCRRKLATRQPTQGPDCNDLQDRQRVEGDVLSATIRREGDSPPGRHPGRRSWPTRSLSHPYLRRRFGGKVERRA